jgi:hypothetical protein
MSQFKYFDLHLSVLNTILSFYKLERFKILAGASMDNTINNLQREIRALTQVDMILPEILDILSQYNSIDP